MSVGNGLIIAVDKEALKDRFLVLGFHGIGNIGHLTIRYLVESSLMQKKGEFIGYILSKEMPPFVEVLQGGKFGIPYEFYRIGDALFLLIRIQPDLAEQFALAEELTRFAKEAGAKGIILIGGIDELVIRDEKPPIAVYVANDEFERLYKPAEWEVKPAPQEILITGGVALFLIHAKHRKLPAIALFVPSRKGVINFEGALEMAKKLIEVLHLPVNADILEKNVREKYASISRMLQEMEEGEPEVEEEVEVVPRGEGDRFLYT